MTQNFKSFLCILCLTFPVIAQTGAQTKSVRFNAIVIDEAKKPVKDIRPEDVVVLENGEPQTILSVSNQERPMIYALTVDNSGSFQQLLGLVKHAVRLMVDENKTNDETALIRFVHSDAINILQDFTGDNKSLTEATENLFVDGGATALYDAIYLSVGRVSEYKSGVDAGRAVIVITDGEDRDSFYSEKQLIKLIEKENVQVFFIGIVDFLGEQPASGYKDPKQVAKNKMTNIAQKSGGMAFFPKSREEFGEASLKIKELLRNQYVITYSAKPAREKDCREPKVKFAKDVKRKDVKIIVRDGCFSTVEK